MLLERDAVGLDTPEHAQTLNHAQHSSGEPAPPTISERTPKLAGDYRRCCSSLALLGLTPLIHARTLIPRSTRRANRSPSTIPRAGGVSERPRAVAVAPAFRRRFSTVTGTMLLKAGAAGLDEVDGTLARVARSTGFSRGGLESRRHQPSRRDPRHSPVTTDDAAQAEPCSA